MPLQPSVSHIDHCCLHRERFVVGLLEASMFMVAGSTTAVAVATVVEGMLDMARVLLARNPGILPKLVATIALVVAHIHTTSHLPSSTAIMA